MCSPLVLRFAMLSPAIMVGVSRERDVRLMMGSVSEQKKPISILRLRNSHTPTTRQSLTGFYCSRSLLLKFKMSTSP